MQCVINTLSIKRRQPTQLIICTLNPDLAPSNPASNSLCAAGILCSCVTAPLSVVSVAIYGLIYRPTSIYSVWSPSEPSVCEQRSHCSGTPSHSQHSSIHSFMKWFTSTTSTSLQSLMQWRYLH